MRKTLLILSVAGLMIFADASDAFARGRGGSGGRGGSSGNVGRGGNNRGGYGYGGGGYGYGGGGYGYGGIGIGIGGLGGYGGYAPNYYYDSPAYYSGPAYAAPVTQVRESYYPASPITQQSVNMKVIVPTADAQVWFENKATTQQGMERFFHSPSLDPGYTYAYTVKARWIEGGQTVTRERQVNVQAGQNILVDFDQKTGESVPPPLTQLPGVAPGK
jgi:uncharacterized protein (TIGR03000 family)